MSAISIQVPFPVFQDRDGQPLENGYIWIGQPNLNPQTNPVVAYYDEALTIVAPQPLRTLNGYVSRAGTPAQIYVDGVNFSILVQDSKGSMVYNFPDGTGIGAQAAGVGFTGFKGQVGFVQDLADNDGSNWVGFLSSGTGAVARSAQDKMRDSVSIKDFGAVGDGVTDDTAAIQAALNSGALSVFIPAGSFLCSSLLMPSTTYFTLHGTGQSSILVQKAGASNALIRWDTSSIVYTQGLIQGIQIKGTNGSSDCINTSGVGGITLQDIYILDVPVGYSGIYLNGIPSLYMHDHRIMNLQVYTNTVGGFAGLRLGPYVADSNVSNYICNNNFKTDYCLYADNGAQSFTMEDSHIYNAAKNIMKCEGGNQFFRFSNVGFDNATLNLIELTSVSKFIFDTCFVQAIKSGQIGVNLTNTESCAFYGTIFDNAFGSVAGIKENGTSNYTTLWGGMSGNNSNYTGDPIQLIGEYSWASGLAGWLPYNVKYVLQGITQTPQTQGTAQYLGLNGGQASINSTEFTIPYDSKVSKVIVSVDVPPAAGQTFTFNFICEGVTNGTGVINSGSFEVAIIPTTVNLTEDDTVAILSTFSASSGSSNVRYRIYLEA
jgi:hypothetical protein